MNKLANDLFLLEHFEIQDKEIYIQYHFFQMNILF